MTDSARMLFPDNFREVPDKGELLCDVGHNGRLFALVHQGTGERITLADHLKDIDVTLFSDHADNAFLAANNETPRWPSDYFKLALLSPERSDDGACEQTQFWVSSLGTPRIVTLDEHLWQHRRCEVTLPMATGAPMRVLAWAFTYLWAGARIWWSLTSLYNTVMAHSTTTAARWRARWWPWWFKAILKLGFDSVHLRKSSQSPNEWTSKGVLANKLEEPSASTFALLVLLVRFTTAGPAVKDEQTRLAWRRVLDGMLLDSFRSPPRRLVLYKEEGLVCVPGLTRRGELLCQLECVDCMVDHSALSTASPAWNAARAGARLGMVSRLIDLLEAMNAGGSATRFLFFQLVVWAGGIIEQIGVRLAPPPPPPRRSIAKRRRPPGARSPQPSANCTNSPCR